MNNTSIKKVLEGSIKVSEDKSKNQVHLTFESGKNGDGTITFTGSGSLKVLTPVL